MRVLSVWNSDACGSFGIDMFIVAKLDDAGQKS